MPQPGHDQGRRAISPADAQRIQAAITRGGIPPSHAAYWQTRAADGDDISLLDLTGVRSPTAGTVAAAGPRPVPKEPEDEAEYRALFGSIQQGQRIADTREVAVKAAVAALTDDQVYENMFGHAGAPAAPVAASAAGGAGQPAPGEAGRPRYRVRTTRVSLRVPGGPDGVAAGADTAKISWRTIELRAGDVVPEDAHAGDVARLLHSKTRLGPMLKPW